MTATFSPDLADDVSKVRQRIGDTDVSKAQIQDETITAYITGQGLTVLATARRLCLDLAGVWSRKAAMITLDDQRSDFSKVATHYITLATEIEKELRPVVSVDGAADPGLYMTSGTCSPFRDSSLDYC